MQSEAVREIKACWGQVACGRPGESAELERTVGEVFVVLRDPIYRYVFSTVRNAGDAEDLTQEAFIRLLRDLRKGHAIENVKAWLFRVAHNLVIDFSRRSPVPESLDAAANQRMTEEMPDPSPSAEERALDWASRCRLLRTLAPQERRCMELRAEGLRYREIAEILGIKIPTVQTTLDRAIKKIVEQRNG